MDGVQYETYIISIFFNKVEEMYTSLIKKIKYRNNKFTITKNAWASVGFNTTKVASNG